MGLSGMMDNLGKVVGPILGGFMITAIGFTATFRMMAFCLVFAIAVFMVLQITAKSKALPPHRPLA